MTPEKLIQQAVEDAIKLDNQSNPRKKLLTTSERNIAFHIGAALKQIIRDNDEFMGYQVDVEYHRQGADDDPKKLDGENVVPDILVHKRGITFEEDKEANYLYMEIKIIDRFNGKRNSITSVKKAGAFNEDKHKLMLAKSEKHYKHTAFLIFNRNGECFLEIDTDSQWKDSFRLVSLTLPTWLPSPPMTSHGKA
jgi:hypothetical protein